MTMAPPRMAGIEASGKVPLPHAETLKPPYSTKPKNEKRNIMAPPTAMSRLARVMCGFIRRAR